MEIMAGTRAPVRMWVDQNTVDYKALNQARNVGNMPHTHGVAVMPDAHFGNACAVGAVIAMRDAVSAAAVGVDIGCGMNALPLNLHINQLPDDLGPVRSAIEAAVPVGQSSHGSELDNLRMRVSGLGGWDAFVQGFDNLSFEMSTRRLNTAAYRERVLSQLGTLGGGNHFIELCTDDDDMVWLMLHSGSRNIGKELAERHIAVAKTLPHNQDLPDKDLAVFLAGTPEMDAYRRDLYWAQEYAARNRKIMIGLTKVAVEKALGRVIQYGTEISCHHNYVSEETYDGLDLLITRKGAISTRDGRLGVIPGSMGTGSYIVQGLANEASFCSASHGAGRRMSRSQAKRELSHESLIEAMQGIEARTDLGVLDEHPAAYKDLESVMAQQTDLVRIVTKLDTKLCVKG